MSLIFPLAALRGAHKIRTYIDQVIGGELLSVVVCDNCKHVSNSYIRIHIRVCMYGAFMCVYVRVRLCVSVRVWCIVLIHTC